jgi:ABC-type Mn2+/Zn2+ transport system permease subunit
MLVALGSEMISRSSRIKEETALAVLYTLAFSAGIVLLSFAHVQVELEHYLFGNILGLSNSDLWITYSISLTILPALVALQRPLLVMLFEPSVARSQGVNVVALNYLLITFLVLAMISSLQAVGVILALGLLVAPAATVYLFSDSCPALFWGGGIVGATGSCVGLLLSYWLNIPAGACIVLLLGLTFFAAFICSPRYGVFRHLFMRRHLHEESLLRWRGQPGPAPGPTEGK